MYILAEVGILRAPGHAICSPPAKACPLFTDRNRSSPADQTGSQYFQDGSLSTKRYVVSVIPQS